MRIKRKNMSYLAPRREQPITLNDASKYVTSCTNYVQNVIVRPWQIRSTEIRNETVLADRVCFQTKFRAAYKIQRCCAEELNPGCWRGWTACFCWKMLDKCFCHLSISFTELKAWLYTVRNWMGDLPDERPEELNPQFFGRDVKLWIPCLEAACIVGLY